MAKTNLDFSKLGALTEMFNTKEEEEKKETHETSKPKVKEERGEEKITEHEDKITEHETIKKKTKKAKENTDNGFVDIMKEKALKYSYLQFSKSVVYLSDKTKKTIDLIAEISGLSSKTVTDICVLEFVEMNKEKLEEAFKSYTEEKQKSVLDI